MSVIKGKSSRLDSKISEVTTTQIGSKVAIDVNVISTTGVGVDGRAVTFADLPAAALSAGQVWIVETATGIPFINRQRAGLYRSDGVNWVYLPELNAQQVLTDNASIGAPQNNVQSALEFLATQIGGGNPLVSGSLVNSNNTLRLVLDDGTEVDVDVTALNDSGLEATDIDTLAKLNAIITDATLIDSASLGAVATSNDYNDLDNLPTIPPTAPVDSVNGQTGTVILDADDISDALTTNKFATQAQLDEIATNTTKVSFPEAPNDGQQYVRQSEAWAVVNVPSEILSYEVYQTTGSALLNNGNYSIISMDTEESSQSGFAQSSGGVQITDAGRYKISYAASVDSTNSNRTSVQAALHINGVELVRSRSFSYHRTVNNGEDTASKSAIITLAANDVIDLRALILSGNGAATIDNASNLILEKIG